jgi:hypothetical protein
MHSAGNQIKKKRAGQTASFCCLPLVFKENGEPKKHLRETLTVNWHLALLPAASDAV